MCRSETQTHNGPSSAVATVHTEGTTLGTSAAFKYAVS
jgi:hypothetical protein